MPFDELRRDYDEGTLFEEEMEDHPIAQFRRWFDEAQAADIVLPDAMVLATSAPNVRTVVLRGIEDEAIVFYTNYESAKARELDADPRAALHFHWNPLHRQVKFLGEVERIARETSEKYWATRPRASQIGGWASPQSTPLKNRAELDRRAAEIERRFEGEAVPCPPNWGGYRLVPHTVEFWQGRPSRLHDRVHYVRQDDRSWRLERLAP